MADAEAEKRSRCAARVELAPGDAAMGDLGACKLHVDVPFPLGSIAEAEVDIGRRAVLVRATATGQEIRVELHADDPEIDVDGASAKFSKKRGQLTISWARRSAKAPAEQEEVEEEPGTGAAPEEPTEVQAVVLEPGSGGSSFAAREDQEGKAEEDDEEDDAPPMLAEKGEQPRPTIPPDQEDEDEDDDAPPMLAKKGEPRPIPPAPDEPKRPLVIEPEEAAAAAAAAKKEVTTLAAEGWGGVPPEEIQTNAAAEAMMRRAMEGKQQKTKQVEAERKEATKNFSGGLKKGFFSAGSDDNKKKTKKPAATGGGGYPEKQKGGSTAGKEGVTYLEGRTGASAREQLLKGLELPEVQERMQDHCDKLKSDNSWVTPKLLQALAQKPHLTQLMQNPKVQEAMQLMQTDPQEAKRRFEGDKDVALFFKEFSGLMATHFDLLSKEEPKKTEQQQQSGSGTAAQGAPALLTPSRPAPKASLPGPAPPAASVRDAPGGPVVPIEDPEVQRALQNPEVRQLIEGLQRGEPLEPREIFRRNPRLFQDVQVLLKAGLLNIQT